MQAPRTILDLVKIPWVRIALEALGILGALWVLGKLSGVLTPVLVGLVLAYMINPLVTWFERWHISRAVAAGVVFGGGILVLFLFAVLSVPTAWSEGVKLYRVGFQGDAFTDQPGADGSAPDGTWQAGEPLTRDIDQDGSFDPSQYQVLTDWMQSKGWIGAQSNANSLVGVTSSFDPEVWLRDQLAEFKASDGRLLLGRITSALGSISYWALAILLVPMYAYFFSVHLQAVSRQIIEHIPARQRDRTLRILGEINVVVGAFFRGRLMICGILGVVACIGFAIAGVPSFLPLGLLMGVLTAVPLVSGLVLVPAVALLYLGGAETSQYVIVAITYGIVQVLEPLLIGAVMGKGVEMHPVLIIVAIFAFGTLLGGIGVLLAVPLAATARILFREFVRPHVRRIAGLDEAPSEASPGSPTPR